MNPPPRQITLTAAALAFIGVGLWLATSGGETQQTTPVDFEQDGWSGASVAADREVGTAERTAGADRTARRPAADDSVRGRRAKPDPRRGARRRPGDPDPDEQARPASDRPSTPDGPAADDAPTDRPAETDDSTPDAGGGRGYRDPVNDHVLGPRRWMAELPRDEAESIERQLSEEIEPEFDVAKKDRRRLTDEVHRLAQRCWRQFLQGEPGVRGGQLIVEFEMVARDGTARVEEPTVTDVVDVQDPDFLACVRERAAGVRAPAERDGSMAIQLPIFFGGMDYRE